MGKMAMKKNEIEVKKEHLAAWRKEAQLNLW
jgi:hypothetical protein